MGRAVGLASSQGVSKLQRRRPAAAPVSTTVIKGVLAKIMPGNSDMLNLRRWYKTQFPSHSSSQGIYNIEFRGGKKMNLRGNQAICGVGIRLSIEM